MQPLLNAVTRYLPTPSTSRTRRSTSPPTTRPRSRSRATPTSPWSRWRSSSRSSRYGQLTYVRVYQGSLGKGDTIVNSRTHKKVKVGRLARMHSDSMEDIERAGRRRHRRPLRHRLPRRATPSSPPAPSIYAMTSIFVPDAVMHARHQAQGGQDGRGKHEQGTQPLLQGGPDLPGPRWTRRAARR